MSSLTPQRAAPPPCGQPPPDEGRAADGRSSADADQPVAVLLPVRYGIPALLLLAGIVALAAAPSETNVDAWAGFTGAGLSVLLLNALFRIGVAGDVERDREDEARAYFDEHGEWPEEAERPAGRRWRRPAGTATPESEAEQARSRPVRP
jgi:hypothetical protein